MLDMDLPPGDYRERKPKGWRWKLPWSHERDAKLPLALSLGCLCFVAVGLANLPMSWTSFGTALMAFIAGGCLMWAIGRD